MTALGHVLLEEHTPSGIGNHAVILTEANEELSAKVINFLENIGYVGFANFDIKFDKRSSAYAFFELNPRQGRSNFYVTNAGCNIAQLLVDDQINKKDLDLTTVTKDALYTVVPKVLARKYIQDSKTKAVFDSLYKTKVAVNPLFYRRDIGIIRMYRMSRRWVSHFYKYPKYYKPEVM